MDNVCRIIRIHYKRSHIFNISYKAPNNTTNITMVHFQQRIRHTFGDNFFDRSPVIGTFYTQCITRSIFQRCYTDQPSNTRHSINSTDIVAFLYSSLSAANKPSTVSFPAMDNPRIVASFDKELCAAIIHRLIEALFCSSSFLHRVTNQPTNITVSSNRSRIIRISQSNG